MTSAALAPKDSVKNTSDLTTYESTGVDRSSSMRSKVCWEIGVAFAVVSIPLSILSVALLAVVLGYRTKTPLDLGGAQPGNSYLVNLSATTITLIASYSSTIAPIAVGSAMTLIFYSISSQIMKASEQAQVADLPTPYQVALLITMRSGGVGALWFWFKYAFRRKFKHRCAQTVKTGTIALAAGLFLA
jgi:hypothetical protein